MVVTTGGSRHEKRHRHEARRREGDRACETKFGEGRIHHAAFALAQARQHVRQPYVVLKRDRRRNAYPAGIEHAQVGVSGEQAPLVVHRAVGEIPDPDGEIQTSGIEFIESRSMVYRRSRMPGLPRRNGRAAPDPAAPRRCPAGRS